MTEFDVDADPREARRGAPVPFVLAALARLVFNVVGIYIVAGFTYWVLGKFGCCFGAVAWIAGAGPLLPVTTFVFPIYSGQWWLLPVLLVAYPVSTFGGFKPVDSPSQMGDWVILGGSLGVVCRYLLFKA